MEQTNYEMFLSVVNSLKCSQGFYSRIANRLNEMTEDEREGVKEHLNSLPKWHDSVDCVLYLEQ